MKLKGIVMEKFNKIKELIELGDELKVIEAKINTLSLDLNTINLKETYNTVALQWTKVANKQLNLEKNK